jgi:hypothetical protein
MVSAWMLTTIVVTRTYICLFCKFLYSSKGWQWSDLYWFLIFLTPVCSGQLSDNVKGICTILVWLLSMGDSLCSNCCLTGALLIGNEKLLPIRCTRIVWAWWPLCLPRRVSLFCKKTLTFCYKSQISPASPDRTVTTFVYVSYASVC